MSNDAIVALSEPFLQGLMLQGVQVREFMGLGDAYLRGDEEAHTGACGNIDHRVERCDPVDWRCVRGESWGEDLRQSTVECAVLSPGEEAVHAHERGQNVPYRPQGRHLIAIVNNAKLQTPASWQTSSAPSLSNLQYKCSSLEIRI